MVLPSNWYQLSAEEQLFVVANLERGLRGLPPYLGLNAALNREASVAAVANRDPHLASGFSVATNAVGAPAMAGAWGQGYNVLVTDYYWMYSDGWGGSRATTSNVACVGATSKGCWAHRDELLGSDPGYNYAVGLHCSDCVMGTGVSTGGTIASMVDLVEEPTSAVAMGFTWAREKGYFRVNSPGVRTSAVEQRSTGVKIKDTGVLVGPTTLHLEWRSVPAKSASEVKVWFFSGAGCNKAISVHTSSYALAKRVVGGGVDLDWSQSGLSGAYSAYVVVGFGTTNQTGNCVSWKA